MLTGKVRQGGIRSAETSVGQNTWKMMEFYKATFIHNKFYPLV